MERLHSIQAMRAIAALMVLVFHLTESRFVLGAAGVDIFFVISGFIMGTVGRTDTPHGFLRKRIARIVPLYWLVTLVMCAGALAGVFSNFTFDAPRLIQSLLFIPHYDPSGQIWPLVVVGWTLNYEMFFYLVFALGLFFGAPLRATLLAMAALVAAGLLLEPQLAALKIFTSPLLLEFAFGLLLSAWAWRLGPVQGLAICLFGTIVLVALDRFGIHDAGPYRIIAWGLPALLIVAGVLGIERAGGWPSFMRPLEKLGDASYSLYLWHGLVIAAVHKFLGHSLQSNAVALALSIMVAFASYRLFERPVGRFLSRRSQRNPAVAAPDGAVQGESPSG